MPSRNWPNFGLKQGHTAGSHRWLPFFCLLFALAGCATGPFDQQRVQPLPADQQAQHRFLTWQFPPIAVWSVEPDHPLHQHCGSFAQGSCVSDVPAELKQALRDSLQAGNGFESAQIETFSPRLRLTLANSHYRQVNSEPGTPPRQEFFRLQLQLFWDDELLEQWPILMHLPNSLDVDSPLQDKLNQLAEVIAQDAHRKLVAGNHLTPADRYRRLGLPNYATAMEFPLSIGNYHYQQTRYQTPLAGLVLDYQRTDARASMRMDIRPWLSSTQQHQTALQQYAEQYRQSALRALQQGRYLQYDWLDTRSIRWPTAGGVIRGVHLPGAFQSLNGASWQTHLYLIERGPYRFEIQLWAPLEEDIAATENALRSRLAQIKLPAYSPVSSSETIPPPR